MGKIVWLASYPKSGNTWLRGLLANLIAGGEQPVPPDDFSSYILGDARAAYYEEVSGKPFAELDQPALYRLCGAVQRLLVERTAGPVLVKTHMARASVAGNPTIEPTLSAGAIYVLRNPLDVAVSYAHHLGVDTSASLARVTDFLAMPADAAARARAVAHASFDSLRALEGSHGFRERPPTAERFFRRGEAGAWRDALGTAEIETITAAHGPAMRAWGYLDADGAPVVGALPVPRSV